MLIFCVLCYVELFIIVIVYFIWIVLWTPGPHFDIQKLKVISDDSLLFFIPEWAWNTKQNGASLLIDSGGKYIYSILHSFEVHVLFLLLSTSRNIVLCPPLYSFDSYSFMADRCYVQNIWSTYKMYYKLLTSTYKVV